MINKIRRGKKNTKEEEVPKDINEDAFELVTN
jgi:hypothetical protein